MQFRNEDEQGINVNLALVFFVGHITKLYIYIINMLVGVSVPLPCLTTFEPISSCHFVSFHVILRNFFLDFRHLPLPEGEENAAEVGNFVSDI